MEKKERDSTPYSVSEIVVFQNLAFYCCTCFDADKTLLPYFTLNNSSGTL